MEQMINKELVKKLRSERSWSQDQLATISGLSIRTIQRVESEGSGSLESKRALAAAFDINVSNLDINSTAASTLASSHRGCKFGLAGATVGILSAYIGISISFTSGDITSAEAGIHYGSLGALYGISCTVIILMSNRYHSNPK